MKQVHWIGVTLVSGLLLLVISIAHGQNVEVNAAIQAELDKDKEIIASWASNSVIIEEVQKQNNHGPIPGLDNEKWKSIPPSDPIVKSLQENPAGRFLRGKLRGQESKFTRAFLNGSNGEKVAFTEKTVYYLHKGMGKFEVPFRKGTAWQGKAEYDEPGQSYAIQISTPVFSEGKPIGVLVVGVNLASLEKSVKK